MISRTLLLSNELGLHARAASKLARTAAEFRSSVTLSKDAGDLVADAKSILSILLLAAPQGVSLLVEVDGPDESEAMSAIESLFLEGFGEPR